MPTKYTNADLPDLNAPAPKDQVTVTKRLGTPEPGDEDFDWTQYDKWHAGHDPVAAAKDTLGKADELYASYPHAPEAGAAPEPSGVPMYHPTSEFVSPAGAFTGELMRTAGRCAHGAPEPSRGGGSGAG
jgi:hypothetical protein